MSKRLQALFLLALVPGCGVPTPPAVTAPAGADAFPRRVTDSDGASLTLTAAPARIVSTAPSNTEILFAVGAGPQVVGVTNYCDYPPEATGRDKVGGFTPQTINTERILGLKPDLVLTTGLIQQPLTESLRRLGLPVLSYDAGSLGEVLRNVRALGSATGHVAEAETLASRLEGRLAGVAARVAKLPPGDRPRVLLVVSDSPLLTAGPRTFAGQMLELAGARNLFDDVTGQYPRVGEEEILKRNPSVILVWRHDEGEDPRERLIHRPGWDRLDAVRDGRVLLLDGNLVARPGVRLFDGLERLVDLLHPAADPVKR